MRKIDALQELVDRLQKLDGILDPRLLKIIRRKVAALLEKDAQSENGVPEMEVHECSLLLFHKTITSPKIRQEVRGVIEKVKSILNFQPTYLPTRHKAQPLSLLSSVELQPPGHLSMDEIRKEYTPILWSTTNHILSILEALHLTAQQRGMLYEASDQLKKYIEREFLAPCEEEHNTLKVQMKSLMVLASSSPCGELQQEYLMHTLSQLQDLVGLLTASEEKLGSRMILHVENAVKSYVEPSSTTMDNKHIEKVIVNAWKVVPKLYDQIEVPHKVRAVGVMDPLLDQDAILSGYLARTRSDKILKSLVIPLWLGVTDLSSLPQKKETIERLLQKWEDIYGESFTHEEQKVWARLLPGTFSFVYKDYSIPSHAVSDYDALAPVAKEIVQDVQSWGSMQITSWFIEHLRDSVSMSKPELSIELQRRLKGNMSEYIAKELGKIIEGVSEEYISSVLTMLLPLLFEEEASGKVWLDIISQGSYRRVLHLLNRKGNQYSITQEHFGRLMDTFKYHCVRDDAGERPFSINAFSDSVANLAWIKEKYLLNGEDLSSLMVGYVNKYRGNFTIGQLSKVLLGTIIFTINSRVSEDVFALIQKKGSQNLHPLLAMEILKIMEKGCIKDIYFTQDLHNVITSKWESLTPEEQKKIQGQLSPKKQRKK